jgi:hypothetical protein
MRIQMKKMSIVDKLYGIHYQIIDQSIHFHVRNIIHIVIKWKYFFY